MTASPVALEPADVQRIDDALVSCAGLLRALGHGDNVCEVAAKELEFVRAAWNRRAPLPADLEEWEKLAEGVTPGPYQVIEIRHPWRLPARTNFPPFEEKRGDHIERQICTVAHHPQSKAPWQVVCCADGVGDGKPVYFVHIDERDARWIAACSPDRILSLVRALSAERARADADGKEAGR